MDVAEQLINVCNVVHFYYMYVSICLAKFAFVESGLKVKIKINAKTACVVILLVSASTILWMGVGSGKLICHKIYSSLYRSYQLVLLCVEKV